MQAVNSQPQTEEQAPVKVKSSLLNPLRAMYKAKNLIVRSWTPKGARYRVLDDKINPLATLTNSEFNFLIQNKIIVAADDTNKYTYNRSVKIVTE